MPALTRVVQPYSQYPVTAAGRPANTGRPPLITLWNARAAWAQGGYFCPPIFVAGGVKDALSLLPRPSVARRSLHHLASAPTAKINHLPGTGS